jgi:hypothetical protein
MKPKHEKTSKPIRNDHKISHLMDLSGIQTLKVPKILKRPLENPRLELGLGKKPVTRNPNPEYSNPNPKYPKPEFCSGISGSNLQNPNLFRVIRVSQSGTRNTRITRTFMCHILMS